MKFKILLIVIFLLSACATVHRNSAVKEKWFAILNSREFQEEKKLFVKRMNGANICFELGVSDFFSSKAESPDPSCLYFSSKIIIDSERSLRQAIQQLKVLQVVLDGFVVMSPEYRNDQIIFIHKSDEKGIVDGVFLDPKDGLGLYRYMGPYRYQSLSGSNTVHSFKKLTDDEIKKAREGLKVYGPSKEFFIINEIWDRLEEK